MVSMLEGRLKKIIAQKFKGKLSKGVIRRETVTTLDTYGDPIPGAFETFNFEGIRESFDAMYRARAGIPENDVSILILLGSTTTIAKQDDAIFMGKPFNQWYQVRRILEIDPATASQLCQCYEIPGP